jgi:predicted regulator of Ras-like GTPase activity (Roadblock/LC7/MglB family)
MRNLGFIALKHEDRVAAYTWYSLATERNLKSQKDRDEIGAALSSEQMEQASRAIKELDQQIMNESRSGRGPQRPKP